MTQLIDPEREILGEVGREEKRSDEVERREEGK